MFLLSRSQAEVQYGKALSRCSQQAKGKDEIGYVSPPVYATQLHSYLHPGYTNWGLQPFLRLSKVSEKNVENTCTELPICQNLKNMKSLNNFQLQITILKHSIVKGDYPLLPIRLPLPGRRNSCLWAIAKMIDL